MRLTSFHTERFAIAGLISSVTNFRRHAPVLINGMYSVRATRYVAFMCVRIDASFARGNSVTEVTLIGSRRGYAPLILLSRRSIHRFSAASLAYFFTDI